MVPGIAPPKPTQQAIRGKKRATIHRAQSCAAGRTALALSAMRQRQREQA